MRQGKRRISKIMLNNRRNWEKASEKYRTALQDIIKEERKMTKENAQRFYDEATAALTEPYMDMVRRKPVARSPHWNVSLQTKWKERMKAREKERK